MKVAIIGATGMVGGVMLEVLQEFGLPVTQLIPTASVSSVGKKIRYRGEEIEVVGLADAVALVPDIALFSAGGAVSLEWAPKFAAAGTTVVDNSSAWRMHPNHKLIVPEINASTLTAADKIIANPNCSTIQMVLALAPLHRQYGIKRLVISTYQSVSGTGVKAVEQMENERNQRNGTMVYPHPIDKNCLPQCDNFTDNGYTKEEMKLVNETRKILGDESIAITATAVRVPVVGGHSESVNVELKVPFELEEISKLLAETPGVIVQDNPQNLEYPMPISAMGKNEVFVGRLRRDESLPNALNMWIVADNLRKGAATNAVQIATYLDQNHLIGEGVKPS